MEGQTKGQIGLAYLLWWRVGGTGIEREGRKDRAMDRLGLLSCSGGETEGRAEGGRDGGTDRGTDWV